MNIWFSGHRNNKRKAQYELPIQIADQGQPTQGTTDKDNKYSSIYDTLQAVNTASETSNEPAA